MMVVGTGGTFVTLGILIFLIALFKRIFPVPKAPEPSGNAK
jgi:hypothetical protein